MTHILRGKFTESWGRKDSLQSFKYPSDKPILQELWQRAGPLPIVKTGSRELKMNIATGVPGLQQCCKAVIKNKKIKIKNKKNHTSINKSAWHRWLFMNCDFRNSRNDSKPRDPEAWKCLRQFSLSPQTGWGGVWRSDVNFAQVCRCLNTHASYHKGFG